MNRAGTAMSEQVETVVVDPATHDGIIRRVGPALFQTCQGALAGKGVALGAQMTRGVAKAMHNLKCGAVAMLLCFLMLDAAVAPANAEPSAADWLNGQVVKIDMERGTVTLKHQSIAYLHVPATTTVFRYVDPRVTLRIKEGDLVSFRADRVEGELRITAVLSAAAAGQRP